MTRCPATIAAISLAAVLTAGAVGAAEEAVPGALEPKSDRFWELVSRDASPVKVAGPFEFTEGPVWSHGDFLLFSDIPADTIYRWDAVRGAAAFRRPSRQSNGLTFDRQGRLIACEHQSRSVTRTESDGNIRTLASSFKGKPLNSPNDVAVFRDGTLFFTDPPYGIRPEQQEQPCQGVYRLWPDTGKLELLLGDFDRPNGIAFSPDYRTLYVADSSNRKHIRSFAVSAAGSLGEGKVFAAFRSPDPGTPDGIKVDKRGNVWSTGPGGIWVIASDGTILGRVRTPEVPANCAWGGADGKDLFVTARTGVYRVRTLVGGPRP